MVAATVSTAPNAQAIELAGRRFVIVQEDEYLPPCARWAGPDGKTGENDTPRTGVMWLSPSAAWPSRAKAFSGNRSSRDAGAHPQVIVEDPSPRPTENTGDGLL